MAIYSQELEKYLKESLAAIKRGVEGDGDFTISGPVTFDLAITNVKEGKAGIKIYVTNADGSVKSEEVSRIKIKATPKRDKAVKGK